MEGVIINVWLDDCDMIHNFYLHHLSYVIFIVY
jgi:hypothetical protein